MADDLDQTVDAQGAVEQPEPTTPAQETPQGEQPPWGDDFDAQRAWSTIQNLRNREKELEGPAREYQRLTSDPNAYVEFGTEKGWVDTAEESDEPDPYGEQPFLTREEWQQFRQEQQQQADQAQQQAANDAMIAGIDEYLGSHPALNGLDEADREWVVDRALKLPVKGANSQGLPLPDVERAIEQFTQWDSARWERVRKSKKAPPISQVGSAGIHALPLDASHKERVAAAMERLNADQ